MCSDVFRSLCMFDIGDPESFHLHRQASASQSGAEVPVRSAGPLWADGVLTVSADIELVINWGVNRNVSTNDIRALLLGHALSLLIIYEGGLGLDSSRISTACAVVCGGLIRIGPCGTLAIRGEVVSISWCGE